MNFIAEKNIVFHPEFVEKKVWSNFHKYAGTVDALASFGGKFGVLDIKTSTGFYPEYNLQTAAYVLALQETEIKRALSLPSDISPLFIILHYHQNIKKRGSTHVPVFHYFIDEFIKRIMLIFKSLNGCCFELL